MKKTTVFVLGAGASVPLAFLPEVSYPKGYTKGLKARGNCYIIKYAMK